MGRKRIIGIGIVLISGILFSGCGKSKPVHEGTEECILLYCDKETEKSNGVVLFNTHNGAIVDVLHSPSQKNTEAISNRYIVCGDMGSIISVNAYETRGISQISCHLNENSRMDYESFEKQFCPECRKNIYHREELCESEENGIYDIVLLDRKTGAIYPVTNTTQSYFIRDFYVDVRSDDSEVINLLLVYAPEE